MFVCSFCREATDSGRARQAKELFSPRPGSCLLYGQRGLFRSEASAQLTEREFAGTRTETVGFPVTRGVTPSRCATFAEPARD